MRSYENDQSMSICLDFREKPNRKPKKDGVVDQVNIMHMSVTATAITLEWKPTGTNRVVDHRCSDDILSVSFMNLRFAKEESEAPAKNPASKTATYIENVLSSGIVINGRKYNFFGHSNSQLKENTCLMFAAEKTDIWARINKLGDFPKTNVAKRAKRLGLLFSSCAPVMDLPWRGGNHPDGYSILDDIEDGDQNFTDGCGYIHPKMMKKLARKMKLANREESLVPSVIQIRYRGFKGVLAINPTVHEDVQFRKSMKKFDCEDDRFCVVDWSRPYSFGKLNQQIVGLLSALGVSDDALLESQREHYERLENMTKDHFTALKFLVANSETILAGDLMDERLGFTKTVLEKLSSIRSGIMEASVKRTPNGDRAKLGIIVEKSRLVFCVNDPTDTLEEDEIFFCPTIDGEPRVIEDSNVALVRNPCLFPGDILLRKAVNREGLRHLVDCVVFPVKGKCSTASCSGGGDLDGDKFTVIWDVRLIPRKMQNPYAYPAADERLVQTITLDSMIHHFAHFNNASLGRVDTLYWKWARSKGILSKECELLNQLFSGAVDGQKINIPLTLQNPPEIKDDQTLKPVWERMLTASQAKYKEFTAKTKTKETVVVTGFSFDMILDLLANVDIHIGNYELLSMCYQWWARNGDRDYGKLEELLYRIDFGSFTHAQKAHARMLGIPGALLENALNHSDILTHGLLQEMKLDLEKFHWKLFYSCSDRYQTEERFLMNRLCEGLTEFARTLIVLQYSEQFAVAVYVPEKVEKNVDNLLSKELVVFGFRFRGRDKPKVQKKVLGDMTLYVGEDKFDMFKGSRGGGTFIWLNRMLSPTAAAGGPVKQQGPRPALPSQRDRREMINLSSISLIDKWFSSDLTKNIDRIRKERVVGIEVYVVSNKVPPRLPSVVVGNTQIPVETLPAPALENYVRSTTDKAGPEDTDILSRLRSFEDGTIPDVPTDPDYYLSLVRIIHFFGLDETSKCEKLIDRLLSRHSPGISIPKEAFQILLYIPSAVVYFIKRIPVLDSDICAKLICSLLRSSPKVLGQLILDQTALLLGKLKSSGRFFDVTEYQDILMAIALVFDANLGTEVNQLIYDTTELICSGHLVKYGYLLCADLLGERTPDGGRAGNEDKTKPYAYLKLMPAVVRNGNVDSKKINVKFLYSVKGISPTKKPRVGDIVRFTSMNKAVGAEDAAAITMQATIIDITGDTLVRFGVAPPPEIELATWEMDVIGNMTTFSHSLDALARFVTQKSSCTAAYGRLMLGLPVDEPEQSLSRGDDEQALDDETAHSFDVEPYVAKLNESQKDAVRKACIQKLTIVQGPPGTGKTHTIVRMLAAMTNKFGKGNVLAVASTNSAADNILDGVIRYGADRAGSGSPVRVGDKSAVDKKFHAYCLADLVEKDSRSQIKKNELELLKNASVIVTTCASSGSAVLAKLDFKVVVIDEASQVTETCALIPIVKSRQVVLVGDHKQLPPQVHQSAKISEELDLGVSLFARLAQSGRHQVIMLDQHYRCHPFIIKFPSEQFYEGRLQAAVRAEDRPIPTGFPWPDPSKPLALVNVEGRESRGKSVSLKNEAEAKMVCDIVGSLLATKAIKAVEIGIITPYKEQIACLRTKLKNNLSGHEKSLGIATVDGFQGREKEVIIFSAVRCNQHGNIGFLEDDRRFNVLMTRAKRGMIVLANVNTMRSSGDAGVLWKKWIDFMERNGLVVDGKVLARAG